MFHRHKWVRVYSNRFGQVEQCEEGGEFRTIMRNYANGDHVMVDGNLLAALGGVVTIYVLCGSKEEYQQVIGGIKTFIGLPNANVEMLENDKQLRTMESLAPIFFYGNWWENDICHSAAFSRIMNGWL
jgi:hypothetical protein